MRKISIVALLLLTQLATWACPVCERDKAKNWTSSIGTHGAKPDSNWDYVIVIAVTIITVLTLVYTVKWLINPKEKNPQHIKYSFLNQD